jgi:peptidoglycan hydrolase-like protein with peptidoglycan-binding domain
MAGVPSVAHQDGGGGCFGHMPDEAGGGGEVQISGSVGLGGKNKTNDVMAIQTALNEVSPANGGPAVPLVVDGIVGQKTVGAIAGFQKKHLGWSDGRVDPNGPTLAKLNAIRGAGGGGGGGTAPPGKSGGAGTLPPATPAENKAFIETIGKQLPEAGRWVSRARFAINVGIDVLKGRLPEGAGNTKLALLEKYYHIFDIPGPNQSTKQIAYLENLQKVFFDMAVVISQSRIMSLNAMTGIGVGYFQADPDDGKPKSKKYDAFTYFGGWHVKGTSGLPRMSKQDNYAGRNLRQDTIFFPVSHYGNKTDEYITLVVIHELAHFVGPSLSSFDRIGDHSNHGNANFLKLAPSVARRTADIYAYFAGEATLNREPTIFK